MAASVAPNMPQPRARVDTVSAEQSALSMPMPEMHASPAPQQEEQQPQQLQQQEPLAHSTIMGEADAIPVVAGSVAIDPAPAPVAGAKVTASKKKSKSKSKGIGGGSVRKKKLSGPPCVGLYVDALDTKMLWSEAQIIECKLEEQKIKVHFIGWHSRWDIWTDAMNVAAHGTFVPLKKKSLENPRRWDGKTNLFSEMVLEPNENAEDLEPLVPLVKDSPEKRKVTKPLRVSVEYHRPSTSLSLPSPSTQSTSTSTPTTAPTPSARKARPPKLAIEKGASKPATTKKSPSSSNKSSSPVNDNNETVKAKTPPASTKAVKTPPPPPAAASATSPTVSGKKRSKSSASGSSSSGASRAPKRLKETPELEPANGTTPMDFAGSRKQNVAEDEQTAGFLQKCATLWQRQLSLLLTRPPQSSERAPGSELKA
ncbi:hypothetical protein Gpo141_00000166 [Globisporangium polare]